MASPEAPPAAVFAADDRVTLLAVAYRSLAYGAAHGRALSVDPREHSEPLRRARSSFVTLRRGEALRGCVGSLEARHPLVVDVSESAFAAGFRDPRFEPLCSEEIAEIQVRISVLSALERLPAGSEEELAALLRPGVDGLVLQQGSRRGTLLPDVWESLADPLRFVREVKRKAGLPESEWSPRLEAFRYTTECIS
jgi:AmmeMemoRadiSam system protein A